MLVVLPTRRLSEVSDVTPSPASSKHQPRISIGLGAATGVMIFVMNIMALFYTPHQRVSVIVGLIIAAIAGTIGGVFLVKLLLKAPSMRKEKAQPGLMVSLVILLPVVVTVLSFGPAVFLKAIS